MPGKKSLGAQISYNLREWGVDVIFGIPGVHNQEMYRGIEEAGIRHILARHEQVLDLWLTVMQGHLVNRELHTSLLAQVFAIS